ncbi:hypothetical protein RRIM16_03135 [Rickettsia conorii subsp. raoultii]|nr:hypothetical protein RRIM16_03135 [Rickettsia conorii subsp. raoultii]
MATSSYKICGTHLLSIRSAPCLIDSLLFSKLHFVYLLGVTIASFFIGGEGLAGLFRDCSL